MKTDDVLKALEICEKLCFFGGQRAGRELWFSKPVDVQNKDIADFVRDVTFLKDFIADLEAKNKICAEVIARQDKEIDKLSKSVDNYESCLKSVEVIRANAIKEFAGMYKAEIKKEYEGIPYHDLYVDAINRLVIEMTGYEDA